MKHNQLFKLLIDIAFYLLIPVIVLFPGAVIYFIIFPGQQVISQLPYADQGVGWKTVLVLFIIYTEYTLFFVGFYNLRKLAALLLKNKIFTVSSVKFSKKIGWFFIACGASSIVLKIGYVLFLSNESQIEFGISHAQLYLFLAIIGVFFLILSKAFERAKHLEEEDKLTF